MGVDRVRAFMGRPWPDEPFVPLPDCVAGSGRSRPQAAWPKNVSPSSQPGLYVSSREGSRYFSQWPAGASKPSSCSSRARRPALPREPGVRVGVLVADEEAHELLRRDGGNLPAQPFEGQTVDPGEQPAVTPLQLFRAREAAAQDHPLHFEGGQGAVHVRRVQARAPAPGRRR